LVRTFNQILTKPICSVINAGGINNATDRQALAGYTLHQVHRANQAVISLLTEQLKNVEIYLKDVFISSTVLKDAISQLINFELVIKHNRNG
jgi:hypothetical protein